MTGEIYVEIYMGKLREFFFRGAYRLRTYLAVAT